jgi:hypothetical protein
VDAVAAAAVDLARGAAQDAARTSPGGAASVGEHLGVSADGDRVVTHRFSSTASGYRGWVWSVVLARAPRAKVATVSEVVLLPADDAVLAPAWLPWSERVRPGDVGPTDVLPRIEDDPRLEPGYAQTGDEDADRVALWELGLGRARVLSVVGRDEAATRWYTGSSGPDTETARAASAACDSCGFYLRLGGSLRTVFGVCANEWSPDDGRVVSHDHGCGAHSETDVSVEPEPLPVPVLDETGYEPVLLD